MYPSLNRLRKIDHLHASPHTYHGNVINILALQSVECKGTRGLTAGGEQRARDGGRVCVRAGRPARAKLVAHGGQRHQRHGQQQHQQARGRGRLAAAEARARQHALQWQLHCSVRSSPSNLIKCVKFPIPTDPENYRQNYSSSPPIGGLEL